MRRAKYPNLIHVTREQLDTDNTYLQVHDDGVFDTAFEQTRDCAIYKLVSVGRVEVMRRFVDGKALRKLTGKR